MTALVLLSDGMVAKYPYQLAELRTDNPGVSFPEQIPDDTLAEFGVFPVIIDDAPLPQFGQRIVPLAPVLDGSAWRQGWSIVEMTQEERRAALLPITRRQAKHALLDAGLLNAAEQAIEALPGSQRTAALIDWNDAAEFERDHPLISAIGAALSLSDEEIDALFIRASSL